MNVVVYGAVILLLIIFSPFASVWALNTLFPALAIPYTFETWLAAILLTLLIQARFRSSNS